MSRTTYSHISVCLAIVFILLFGCAKRDDQKAFVDNAETQAAMEWMRSPSVSNYERYKPLMNSYWRPVESTQETQAESMVRDSSFIALTDMQATQLTNGYQTPVSRKSHPFLLRGITSPFGTARTQILTDVNGEMLVQGGALSHHPIPIRRQCLVVWLDIPPRNVYVSFGVAE